MQKKNKKKQIKKQKKQLHMFFDFFLINGIFRKERFTPIRV